MRVSLLHKLLSDSIAANIVDIYASMSSGALAEDYAKHKPALGKVKLQEFMTSF